MSTPATGRQFHLKEAKRCFNETWELLSKDEREPADDLKMLDLAHSSRYHWSFVGGPVESAVGAWQISRVYAALRQPSLSLRYAVECLGICEVNDLQDLLQMAFEGMARASASTGDFATAKRFIVKARAHLAALKLDRDDRDVYSGQIEETEGLISPAGTSRS